MNKVFFAFIIFTSCFWACTRFTNNGKPYLTIEENTKDGIVLQWNTPDFEVRINPPVLNIEQGQETKRVELRLESHSHQQNKAILQYEVLVDTGKGKVTGSYMTEIVLPDSGSYLQQTSQLIFQEGLKMNLSVTWS